MAATAPLPGAAKSSDQKIRIMLVGLGAVGLSAGRSLRKRSDCELVCAVERDPALVGRDLGEVLGGAASDVIVENGVAEIEAGSADVAVVATTSWLDELEPIVTALVSRGINVVSICEELAYPWMTHRAIAERIDRLARVEDVSVLGTGANPGFLLDTLPLALSSMSQRISHVDIRRTAEMSGYAAILEKFGLGLTIAAFDAAQTSGLVVGHIGFEEAIAALCGGLGWNADEVAVDPVRPAFLAPRERKGAHFTVPAGTVTAVTHAARAKAGGETVIDLSITFGIFERGDPVEQGDRLVLRGEEQTIAVTASEGFDSFLSTVAVVTNVAADLVKAPSGLLTMADLPIRSLGSKGARRGRAPAQI